MTLKSVFYLILQMLFYKWKTIYTPDKKKESLESNSFSKKVLLEYCNPKPI